jgi:hypothetical protein
MMMLKHDIFLLGRLDPIRFSYKGSSESFVGVMAQEVQLFQSAAGIRGNDGYVRSLTIKWA